MGPLELAASFLFLSSCVSSNSVLDSLLESPLVTGSGGNLFLVKVLLDRKGNGTYTSNTGISNTKRSIFFKKNIGVSNYIFLFSYTPIEVSTVEGASSILPPSECRHDDYNVGPGKKPTLLVAQARNAPVIFVCGEAQTMEQSILLLFLFLGELLWFSNFFKIPQQEF